MARKKHSAEEIIGKLREAEVLLAQGKKVPDVCRQLGISQFKVLASGAASGYRPPATTPVTRRAE